MKPEVLVTDVHSMTTVASSLKSHLRPLLDLKAVLDVSIASAYFNPGGFSLLADELEDVLRLGGVVRILLGEEPPSPPLPYHEEKSFVFGQSLKKERDKTPFAAANQAQTRRLIEWLEGEHADRVEVRMYTADFLHGKTYIVSGSTGVSAFAGSSNFTYAGLAKNNEMNLGVHGDTSAKQVLSWYDGLWEVAVPYDLAAVYAPTFSWHAPHDVYVRMLMERYPVLEEPIRRLRPGLKLAPFQKDGADRAEAILEKYHGVIVADGVGLGKTYLAGEIIRRWVQEKRQRALVVAPKVLKEGTWFHFREAQNFDFDVISYEDLVDYEKAKRKQQLAASMHDYGLIVIDEAHALRNLDTRRSKAASDLLSGVPVKDVLLLTATPVNNSLDDLRNLISYFVRNDGAFAHLGIPSIDLFFKELAKQDAEALSPDILFPLLDEISVRRTRRFVKKAYPTAEIEIRGELQPISFPSPRVQAVEYDFSLVLPGMFSRLEHLLSCADEDCADETHPVERPLSLARYTPSRYRTSAITENSTVQQEVALAGLLRSGLLKRFESSAHAFSKTCRRMVESHDAFLTAMDAGTVLSGKVLNAYVKTLASADEAADDQADKLAMETLLATMTDDDGEYVIPTTEVDEVTLRADIEEDRDLLIALADLVETSATQQLDPKVEALVSALKDVAAQAKADSTESSLTSLTGGPTESDRRKVIVFTQYADTAEYLLEQVRTAIASEKTLQHYADRVVLVSGSPDAETSAEKAEKFTPSSMDLSLLASEPGEYDILIATDVLSEGVNLQQCRNIINYDLPWNPMRLVQRHGRVDRIGSLHSEVIIRCFFPDTGLDAVLGLHARLVKKLAQADAAGSSEGEVLPGITTQDVNHASLGQDEARIRALREGDASLFDEDDEGRLYALTGEEFRATLSATSRRDAISALPMGAGSAKFSPLVSSPTVVFCTRVEGSALPPVFAMRSLNLVSRDTSTLRSLNAAYSPVLKDPRYGTPTRPTAGEWGWVYDAWALERTQIVEEWNFLSDPANSQPSVDKALRRAQALIEEEDPNLARALGAPHNKRIAALFRRIMKDETLTDQERRTRIVATALDLGLTEYSALRRTPTNPESVSLVCWMLLLPEVAAK